MKRDEHNMLCCNFIFKLTAISVVYLTMRVSAIHREEAIRGGFIADQEDFKYQVAIIGIQNYSTSNNLICGGAIVSDYFVLSAAQCFTDLNGNLKNLRFSVTVGAVDLKLSTIIKIEVDFILVHYPGQPAYLNDIALVQLGESLDLANNHFISKVELPHAGESFTGRGLVSGYGYNWIETAYDPERNREMRILGGTDYVLRFGVVEIVNNTLARRNYRDIFIDRQLCGKMLSSQTGEAWGFCTKDTGGPFVIGNKIVGIASVNPLNCDDTVYGGIYTKVSAYAFFIESILEGLPALGTLIYSNRQYVSEQPS